MQDALRLFSGKGETGGNGWGRGEEKNQDTLDFYHSNPVNLFEITEQKKGSVRGGS